MNVISHAYLFFNKDNLLSVYHYKSMVLALDTCLNNQLSVLAKSSDRKPTEWD